MSETPVSDRPRDDDERKRDTSSRTTNQAPSSGTENGGSEFLQIVVTELNFPFSFSIGKLKVLASGRMPLYALLLLLVVLIVVVVSLWAEGIIP